MLNGQFDLLEASSRTENNFIPSAFDEGRAKRAADGSGTDDGNFQHCLIVDHHEGPNQAYCSWLDHAPHEQHCARTQIANQVDERTVGMEGWDERLGHRIGSAGENTRGRSRGFRSLFVN